MLQLLVAVKQCHENGVCHGKSCFNWNPTLEMHFLHWCYKLFAFLLLFKVISSVRMCWLLPPIGFTLLTLHLSNPLTFHMMTPLISLFSLTLVDEDSVILHLRFLLFPPSMSILFVFATIELEARSTSGVVKLLYMLLLCIFSYSFPFF